MSRNFFDELKKTILDETNVPDAHVGNLHGAPLAGSVIEDLRGSQTWYLLSVDSGNLLTLNQFIDEFTNQRTGHQSIVAQDGELRTPPSSPDQVQMLYTMTNASGPILLPIDVDAPGYEFAIYRGATLIARGEDALRTTLDVAPGRHALSILLYGGSDSIAVSTPPNFTLAPQEIIPDAPVLHTPTAHYLDEGNGSFVVELSWNNTINASGWQVYRAGLEARGTVSQVNLEPTGVYSLTVAANDYLELEVGEPFYIEHTQVGTVLSSETNEDTNSITAQILPEEDVNASEWIGAVYMRPTDFQPITRLSYSGNSVLRWHDTAVRKNRSYVYKVTSLGFIDGTTESEYSEPRSVFVQDRDAPGNVTQLSHSIINQRITVEYRAPIDLDYRATRLYRELPNGEHRLILTDFGQPGEPSQFSFEPTTEATFWLRTLDWAGNEQPIGQGVSFYFDGDPHWRDSLHGSCVARIVGSESDDTHTVIQVHAVPGTGTVRLISVTDNVSWIPVDAPGYAFVADKEEPSGTKWKFRRPLYEQGLGEVVFRASVPGHAPDEDHVILSEVGQDTIGLILRVQQIEGTTTTRKYRVSVGDPVDPQRADGGVKITYSSFGVPSITPASGSSATIIPATKIGKTPDASEALGGYVDFQVTLPAPGVGGGRIVFVAERGTDRIQDVDPVEVPEVPSRDPTVRIMDPVIVLTHALYAVTAKDWTGATTGLEWRYTYWWTHTEHPGWPHYQPMQDGAAAFTVPRHARYATHVEVQVRDIEGRTARASQTLFPRSDTPPENHGGNQWGGGGGGGGGGYIDDDPGGRPRDERRYMIE